MTDVHLADRKDETWHTGDMKVIRSKLQRPFTVLYEPAPEGGYLVRVPLLPDIVTYGRTIEEARSMATDAIKCSLEGLRKEREPLPVEDSFLQERLIVRF